MKPNAGMALVFAAAILTGACGNGGGGRGKGVEGGPLADAAGIQMGNTEDWMHDAAGEVRECYEASVARGDLANQPPTGIFLPQYCGSSKVGRLHCSRLRPACAPACPAGAVGRCLPVRVRTQTGPHLPAPSGARQAGADRRRAA